MENLFRYKLVIEYLGKNLCGWQRQKDATSVQEIIEAAIYKFSNERVMLCAAGRTDAGVNAIGQVAHFDLAKYYNNNEVLGAINHFVKPYKIGIIACNEVDNSFHARFSAKARHYLYKIINRPGQIIIDEDRAWWVKTPLNIEKMQEGANYLIGKHDFTSFRAIKCQSSSPIKTLTKLEIIKIEDEIRFYVSAPSFLHHMVRNIIGSLYLVGIGKINPEMLKDILIACNRQKAGATAPAYGLYFLKVDY